MPNDASDADSATRTVGASSNGRPKPATSAPSTTGIGMNTRSRSVGSRWCARCLRATSGSIVNRPTRRGLKCSTYTWMSHSVNGSNARIAPITIPSRSTQPPRASRVTATAANRTPSSRSVWRASATANPPSALNGTRNTSRPQGLPFPPPPAVSRIAGGDAGAAALVGVAGAVAPVAGAAVVGRLATGVPNTGREGTTAGGTNAPDDPPDVAGTGGGAPAGSGTDAPWNVIWNGSCSPANNSVPTGSTMSDTG